MKKLFKKSSLIFTLLLTTVFFTTNVYAWYIPSNNKTALAVGATYSDGISSVNNANDAYSTYNAMGLTSKKITSPSSSNLTGSHANGTPYLQSGIVYLNGHADYYSMEFPNSVYITKSSSISGSSIGIGYYDNTKTALIEFAGCNTASNGSNNITKYGNDQGANITIGWTTELNVASFVNWNTRFNDKIQTKTTSVNSTAQSASNHIYLSNTVKNYKVYGAGGYNPWYWITGSTTATSTNPNTLETNEYIIEADRSINYYDMDNNVNFDRIVSDFIINNINTDFDLNNYKLETSGNDVKYYDYVLYVGNIRTNLGYTLSINKDNEIHLFDNMQKYNEKDAVNHVLNNENKYKNINYNKFEKLALSESLKDIDGSTSKITNRINYYDFDLNKAFYVIEVLNTTQSGAMNLYQYQYDI